MKTTIVNYKIDPKKLVYVGALVVNLFEQSVEYSFEVKALDESIFTVARYFTMKELHLENGEKLFDGGKNEHELRCGTIKFTMLKEFIDFKNHHEELQKLIPA
jgi:hypothetical protein